MEEEKIHLRLTHAYTYLCVSTLSSSFCNEKYRNSLLWQTELWENASVCEGHLSWCNRDFLPYLVALIPPHFLSTRYLAGVGR